MVLVCWGSRVPILNWIRGSCSMMKKFWSLSSRLALGRYCLGMDSSILVSSKRSERMFWICSVNSCKYPTRCSPLVRSVTLIERLNLMSFSVAHLFFGESRVLSVWFKRGKPD